MNLEQRTITIPDTKNRRPLHVPLSRQSLAILFEGDKQLLNPYSTILINSARHPAINSKDARIWHEWLTSAAGQQAIAGYRIHGEQLFFPSAKP